MEGFEAFIGEAGGILAAFELLRAYPGEIVGGHAERYHPLHESLVVVYLTRTATSVPSTITMRAHSFLSNPFIRAHTLFNSLSMALCLSSQRPWLKGIDIFLDLIIVG